jgi:exo-beta-1,3-glucanase (GH17 family)
VVFGKDAKGITYQPFKGTPSRGENSPICKTHAEYAADIQEVLSHKWRTIRIYGVDCDAVDIVLSLIDGKGVNLIVGVADRTVYSKAKNGTTVSVQMNLHDQTELLVQQVRNRWQLIEYVTVLDHPTTAFGYPVSLVATSVQTVKALIPKKVKITVPDDWTAYYTHPDLCHVGQDFVTAAVQPVYYSVGVDGAGPFVLSSKKNVSDTCHQKEVEIVGRPLYDLC